VVLQTGWLPESQEGTIHLTVQQIVASIIGNSLRKVKLSGHLHVPAALLAGEDPLIPIE
jgi:hypothetical protein